MVEKGIIQIIDILESRREEEANDSKKGEKSKGSSVDGLVDTPPSNRPPSGLAVGPDKLIVTREWIELCEQRRLPLKNGYQLQFKDTMWLKTDVRRLRS